MRRSRHAEFLCRPGGVTAADIAKGGRSSTQRALMTADCGTGVPRVSEAEMWAAELAYLPEGARRIRTAQFAIRTAVRAQALAQLAGTLAIDELLDARSIAATPAARTVYETAINYLRRQQELNSKPELAQLRRELSDNSV